MPYQGRILFFGAEGVIVSALNVILVGDGRMITNVLGTGNFETWTSKAPVQPVTAIQLSATSLEIFVGESQQITATVLPEDADNKSVVWESSDESVAKLSGDLILAIANGTAVITCTATDGSGVKAECTVTVKIKDMSGKDSAGREYVDLGLPGGVLWATCNVGADKPEESGLYFAWGETTGYAKGESHTFDWANYKWCNGSKDSMTKYCTSSSYGKVDNMTVLDSEDDAATANWGTGWRMPTEQELNDLYDSKYTTTEWVAVNGVNGRKITSKSNGNTIFLPAAGYRNGTSLDYEGSSGHYWSRELYTSSIISAYGRGFGSSGVYGVVGSRNCGLSVRAVRVGSE